MDGSATGSTEEAANEVANVAALPRAEVGRRKVVLVSGYPIARSLAQGGFSYRYELLLEILAAEHDVRVVYVGPRSRFAPHLSAVPREVEVSHIEFSDKSRKNRALAASRVLAFGAGNPMRWERELSTLLRDWEPDLVIGLMVKWHQIRVPARSYPTLLFVEEDFASLPGQQGRGLDRLLRTYEAAAERRSVRHSSSEPVVISPREKAWASRHFPGRQSWVVPHSVDIEFWAEPGCTAPEVRERDVLVLGHMGHERNSAGLRDVAIALAERYGDSAPRLLVVSADAPHSVLRDVPPQTIEFLGFVEDPRPYYRCAAVLVPSFVATGAKTTILQAWAAGRPVVTTTASANSVGATDGVEVLAEGDAAGVADALVRIVDHDDGRLAERLVSNARKRLALCHSRSAVRDALNDAVASVQVQGSLSSAR